MKKLFNYRELRYNKPDGETGFGDGYDIGCSKLYTIFEIAQIFESESQMLLERRCTRMSVNVICKKTLVLGWNKTKSIADYIENIQREYDQHAY